jgi:hypothetical protein
VQRRSEAGGKADTSTEQMVQSVSACGRRCRVAFCQRISSTPSRCNVLPFRPTAPPHRTARATQLRPPTIRGRRGSCGLPRQTLHAAVFTDVHLLLSPPWRIAGWLAVFGAVVVVLCSGVFWCGDVVWCDYVARGWGRMRGCGMWTRRCT